MVWVLKPSKCCLCSNKWIICCTCCGHANAKPSSPQSVLAVTCHCQATLSTSIWGQAAALRRFPEDRWPAMSDSSAAAFFFAFPMSKWLRLMDNVTFQPPEGLGLGFLKFCASPIEACWEPGPRKFCRMFDVIVWGLHIDSSVRSVSLSSQDQMLAQGRDLRFNFSGASTRTVRGSGSGGRWLGAKLHGASPGHRRERHRHRLLLAERRVAVGEDVPHGHSRRQVGLHWAPRTVCRICRQPSPCFPFVCQ